MFLDQNNVFEILSVFIKRDCIKKLEKLKRGLKFGQGPQKMTPPLEIFYLCIFTYRNTT